MSVLLQRALPVVLFKALEKEVTNLFRALLEGDPRNLWNGCFQVGMDKAVLQDQDPASPKPLMKEDALNDIGIPSMIQGIFPCNEAIYLHPHLYPCHSKAYSSIEGLWAV